MLDERIKILVVVQQLIPAFDTSGRNHSMDGLANGHAELAQRAEIPRDLNRDFLAAQFHYLERSQHFPRVIKVSFVSEALQDLSQYQVTSGQRLLTKQPVEYVGLSRDRPLEVIVGSPGTELEFAL